MRACRDARSHDPWRGLGARALDHLRAAGVPHVAVEYGRAGVIRGPAPTEPAVDRSAPQLDEDEQRLAALWEPEFEADAAKVETDDAIAALFSTSPDDAAQTPPRAAASRTRRATTRTRGQRSRAGSQPRRPSAPRRLLAAGALATVAALLAV
ncbi:MAG: hypothetical protein QOJ89_4870, partial [bacterium]